MEEVAEGVFAETNIFGCNPGFIVTSDGVVMVDTPQKPTNWVGWKEAVASHGPVRWLINTEFHWDHTMGNPHFEGTIVAHDATLRDFYNVSPLWDFGIDGVLPWIGKADPEGVQIAGDYKPRAPEVTFSHDMTLYVGDTELRLLHTPGHTEGETVVYLPGRGVLFATDNLFVDHVIWFQDADPFDWLESLARIKGLDADRIVPGHGSVCGKEWIGLMEEKIQELLSRVRGAIAKGLSEEETAASVKYRDLCVLDEDYKAIHDQVEAVSVRKIYRKVKERG
ncbi:MAG: MBL fold metallo-hydrolase [bacterium]